MPHQPSLSELAPALVLMAAIFVMFWFTIIRPAKLRQRQHARLVTEIKVGDEIVTVGGIYGRIARVSEDSVEVDVAANTRLTFDRRAIRRRRDEKEIG
jgi:preprotein translocase subunit YajC